MGEIRRNLPALLIIAGALVLGAAFAWESWQSREPAEPQVRVRTASEEELRERIAESLEPTPAHAWPKAADVFGGAVRLSYADVPYSKGPWRGEVVDEALLPGAAALVSGELQRYPEALVERLGVREVLLVQSLHSGSAAGYYWGPGPTPGSIALSISAPADGGGLRRQVHAAIFASIDRRMTRSIPPREWMEMTPADGWGAARRKGYEGSFEGLSEQFPGFLSPAATDGSNRDRRVVFSWLMTEPMTVAERASRDEGVARKVAILKEEMKAFDPDFYW